jgi:hypothetical protein
MAMAKRARAISYELDCPKKTITITWKVLITGRSSNDVLADMVIQNFKEQFARQIPILAPDGVPWRLGTCKVHFKIDAVRAVGRDPTKAELDGDRDVIELRDPQAGGGGVEGDLGDGKAPLVIIHPDSDTGGLKEWKATHEMGHGLGIDDPKDGKWLTDKPPDNKIKDKHIEEILNKAPKEKKKAINECCGSHLTVAMGKIVEFPEESFLASNPRDPLFTIFPPDMRTPFTAAYTKRMVAWQRLVDRIGLTAAYSRMKKEAPAMAAKRKSSATRRKSQRRTKG